MHSFPWAFGVDISIVVWLLIFPSVRLSLSVIAYSALINQLCPVDHPKKKKKKKKKKEKEKRKERKEKQLISLHARQNKQLFFSFFFSFFLPETIFPRSSLSIQHALALFVTPRLCISLSVSISVSLFVSLFLSLSLSLSLSGFFAHFCRKNLFRAEYLLPSSPECRFLFIQFTLHSTSSLLLCYPPTPSFLSLNFFHVICLPPFFLSIGNCIFVSH